MLVLAMVLLLAVGIVGVSLATFATQAETTSEALTGPEQTSAAGAPLATAPMSERALRANAASAATVTIQAVRSVYTATGLTYTGSVGATACSPSWVSTDYLFNVWCRASAYPGAAATRVVQFYVCSTATTGATCTASGSSALALYAQVSYDDVPTSQPTSSACSSLSTSTCGLSMTVDRWDVRLADS